jgi:hypothetical protein
LRRLRRKAAGRYGLVHRAARLRGAVRR